MARINYDVILLLQLLLLLSTMIMSVCVLLVVFQDEIFYSSLKFSCRKFSIVDSLSNFFTVIELCRDINYSPKKMMYFSDTDLPTDFLLFTDFYTNFMPFTDFFTDFLQYCSTGAYGGNFTDFQKICMEICMFWAVVSSINNTVCL